MRRNRKCHIEENAQIYIWCKIGVEPLMGSINWIYWRRCVPLCDRNRLCCVLAVPHVLSGWECQFCWAITAIVCRVPHRLSCTIVCTPCPKTPRGITRQSKSFGMLKQCALVLGSVQGTSVWQQKVPSYVVPFSSWYAPT